LTKDKIWQHNACDPTFLQHHTYYLAFFIPAPQKQNQSLKNKNV